MVHYFWMKEIIEKNGYDPEWLKSQDWSVFSKFKDLIKKTDNRLLKLKYKIILYSYFFLLAVALFCLFYASSLML